MEQKRCYGCMRLKDDQPVCPHCGYDERTQNDIHQLPTGTVLKEQYLIGRVLGQGGFGITYLAWDLYLDTPVAVKEYFPKEVVMRECSVSTNVSICTTDGETRFRNNKERFLREAKMLARFSQTPEIVQVRNFFLANNTAYIVMEYVEGITLKQYVADQGGKLSVEETMAILRPILRALAMVHKAGLIHRDISPDNIMLLPGGGAKLLDFGAVRDVANGSSASTEAILKRGFAPIEQYQKRGNLGPWTDVYAMSATIYYCVTGEVLLDSPDRLLEYEDLDLSKKAPQLPEYQCRALEHGLQLRTENRTASVEALYRELFPENRDFARQAGLEAARQGYTLVSGNARGADTEGQEACLTSGGKVICVIADALETVPDNPNVLYLSEEDFDAPFSPQRALHRNHVIHALGSVTIAAQCRLKCGGTWNGSEANLRHGFSPLCCFRDGSEAAQELEQMGATLIGTEELSDLKALCITGSFFENPLPEDF